MRTSAWACLSCHPHVHCISFRCSAGSTDTVKRQTDRTSSHSIPSYQISFSQMEQMKGESVWWENMKILLIERDITSKHGHGRSDKGWSNTGIARSFRGKKNLAYWVVLLLNFRTFVTCTASNPISTKLFAIPRSQFLFSQNGQFFRLICFPSSQNQPSSKLPGHENEIDCWRGNRLACMPVISRKWIERLTLYPVL